MDKMCQGNQSIFHTPAGVIRHADPNKASNIMVEIPGGNPEQCLWTPYTVTKHGDDSDEQQSLRGILILIISESTLSDVR